MKDIFVDTNVAQQFCNPVAEEYKALLTWIQHQGVIVLSNKLIMEIGRGNQTLWALINLLIQKGRINKISNRALADFEFTKKQHKDFLCNSEDRIHLKSIVLSVRKMAIVGDANLLNDINSLPKYNKIKPIAADSPNKINYQ